MARNNEGVNGVDSIRIGGKPIDQLNRRQQMEARVAIELTEHEKAVRAVKGRYPPFNVAAMEAAVREAQANIDRFNECIQKEQATIADFTANIALCRQRDKELAALGEDDGK